MTDTSKPTLTEPATARVTGALNIVRTRLQTILARIQGWRLSIWAQKYNPSQWCYFFSALLILLYFTTDTGESILTLAGWIAFLGLTRELLHLFNRIWHTTLGKSVILILYASAANIALAYAAMNINYITGVEPTPFVFTLGFTTLVLMPFWITLSTVVFFSIFMIGANLWLLVRLPLKLIGFNIQLHWEDRHRALLTMVLRIVLIPFAITAIFSFTLPYFTDFMNEDHRTADVQPVESEPTQTTPPELTVAPVQPAPQGQRALPAEVQQQIDRATADLSADVQQQVKQDISNAQMFDIYFSDDSSEQEIEETRKKGLLIKRLIANFIWYLEAYPNSRCQKPNDARSVPIDELSVLFIHRDADSELGYRYEVAECKLRYAAQPVAE